MFGLSYADIAVILVYFMVLFYIGFWAMKRVKNQEDFFLGGRRFGKIIQVFAAFGQATSSDTGPSVATTTANNGAAGIWAALMMLFATPSYWLTGVWYRRLRVMTMGDYFAERYASKFLGGVYSLMASISLMLLLTVGFIVMTKTVMVMTPKSVEQLTVEEKAEYQKALRLEELENRDFALLTSVEKEELTDLRTLKPRSTFSHIDKNWLILVVVIVVCMYSIAGGLEAAFVCDLMQGVFIILLSIILLPFAFIEINQQYGSSGIMGAFRSLHEQLPESFFEIFGSPKTIDFTWYYIIMLGLMATINVAAGANQLVAAGAAKNEYAARFGLTYGTYLKRITTVFWGLTALAIVLLYGNSVTDPDHLWGYASRQLLGPLNLGLIGLMIAAILAALLSTADMMMLTSSGLMTHSIYRPIFPGKSEKHYVTVGRAFGAIIVICAALIVIKFDDLFKQLKFFWEWGVVFSAGFWMGIMWRRTNRRSVWYSILLTLLLFFLIPMLLPAVFPSLKTNEYLLKRTESSVIERTYTAHLPDVEFRNQEIYRWTLLPEHEKMVTPEPKPLQVGERFVKRYKLPEKSVFWTQGITKNNEGKISGSGMLSLELAMLDALGWDLSRNKYAVNETLRIFIRTIFPFAVIVVFSFLYKHSREEEDNLDTFYVKMKTKVKENREEDNKELELSYQNPRRFDHRKMFPGTQWEVLKWSREDGVGFLYAIGMVIGILLLLYFLVNLGGKIG